MEEDGTEKPEPPGDAPAADRDAAASASGPAELQSSCFRAAPPPAVSSSVRSPARAPLPLLQVVGRAGASEELDDHWADDLPELRDAPLHAKRLKLGKISEGGAVVSLTSSPPASPLATSAVQPPGLVELRRPGETELYDSLTFIQMRPHGKTLWQSRKNPSFFGTFDTVRVRGWHFGQFVDEIDEFEWEKGPEDLVMSPPLSSWK